METTTNLGLKKPAETEFYDVNDFNENADKIDAAVSQLETAIAARAMGVYNEGFIGGLNAALLSTGGAAVGAGAKAGKGLAGGKNASAAEGAAIGSEASASHGVAAGRNARTLHGAALGDGAKTVDAEGNPITAVQLGAGTNSDPNTFQVFSYQMMDANGHIPAERINKAITQNSNDNSDKVATTAFVLNRMLNILSRSGIVTLSKIKINFKWVLGAHGSTNPTCTFEYTDIQGADITDWYADMSGCKWEVLTDTTATTRALWIGISKTNKSILYVGVTDGSASGSGYDDLPDGYNFTLVKSSMTFPSTYIGTYDLETGTITEEV